MSLVGFMAGVTVGVYFMLGLLLFGNDITDWWRRKGKEMASLLWTARRLRKEGQRRREMAKSAFFQEMMNHLLCQELERKVREEVLEELKPMMDREAGGGK